MGSLQILDKGFDRVMRTYAKVGYGSFKVGLARASEPGSYGLGFSLMVRIVGLVVQPEKLAPQRVARVKVGLFEPNKTKPTRIGRSTHHG